MSLALSLLLLLLTSSVIYWQQGFAAERFRTSFAFSPILGGPKLLPVHVSTVITDSLTEDRVVLDFIPNINPASADDMLQKNKRLLQGQSIPGVHRMRLIVNGRGDARDDNALTTLAESILKDCSKHSALNLFSNNCYHFAFRAWRMVSQLK